MSDVIRTMIVDDHALVRMGLKRLLHDIEDIKVASEANSGEEALKLARQQPPDVVLLDVKMPGIGGLETTRRLLRINNRIRIIAVTAYSDDPFPSRILQAGAYGYLTKECSLDEMVTAIRKVYRGERYLSAEIAQQLALRSVSDNPSETSPLELLSERELQVMMMIANGWKVTDISERLHLSSKTVNSYRYRVFTKLNIKNDVEITHLAIRHGLIESDSLIEK